MELGLMIWLTEAVMFLSILGIPIALFAIYRGIKTYQTNGNLKQQQETVNGKDDKLLET
ncbi:MAG: hypothetical protein F6K36_05160 [Symploca sp. SIO3C6]|nr:hypothetical protein [Symploca sp. SIO3C6]